MASYDNGSVVSSASCVFDTVVSAGTYTCAITNTADTAGFTIAKHWVVTGENSGEADSDVRVDVACTADILSVDGQPVIDPDGRVSVLDALQVINRLNMGVMGEGEGATVTAIASGSLELLPTWIDDSDDSTSMTSDPNRHVTNPVASDNSLASPAVVSAADSTESASVADRNTGKPLYSHLLNSGTVIATLHSTGEAIGRHAHSTNDQHMGCWSFCFLGSIISRTGYA